MSEAFLKVCHKYTVAVKEEPTAVFLGMQFDYKADMPTVCVAEKTLSKVRNAGIPESRRMTIGQVEESLGRMFFCSNVLALDLSKYFYAIKYYRFVERVRQLQSATSAEYVVVWESAARQLEDLRQEIIINKPRLCSFKGKSYGGCVYTDASDSGFGVVWIRPTGDVWVVAQSWWARGAPQAAWWCDPAYLPPINQREMFAIGKAENLLKQNDVQEGTADLRIDSQVCKHVIDKGYSASYHLNERYRDQVEAKFWRSVELVDTKRNWADFPSRMFSKDKRTT